MKYQVSRPDFSSITDYKWLALGAALLAALLAFNGQISRGDENEGSGIGGTGRATVPGSESGLGGTGFRPYLGSNSQNDNGPVQPELVLQADSALTPIAAAIEHSTAASIPAPEMPIPRIVELVSPSEVTSNSAAISIAEQIQQDLDRDVFLLQQAAAYRAEELEGYVDSPYLSVPGHGSAMVSQSVKTSAQPDAGDADATEESGSADAISDLNWSKLVNMMAHSNSGSQATAAGDENLEPIANGLANETDRIERPERIARPSLPPVQRIRPLQRPGLLPPRIRPLQF